ncbi:MAG: hypothetical protein KDA91_07800 [Planctomycetaceae bacterium]|nr:hypothetical protein [Planctomycetaceae bacterium]
MNRNYQPLPRYHSAETAPDSGDKRNARTAFAISFLFMLLFLRPPISTANDIAAGTPTALNWDESTMPAGQTTPPSAAEDVSAFAPMAIDQARTQVLSWIAMANIDSSVARQVTALWADKDEALLAADELLDRVIQSFALADTATLRLSEEWNSGTPGQLPLADGIRKDEFFQNAVRLFHARCLTQHRLYDEALLILEDLNPDASIDPAGLFFYRAVCQQKLLKLSDAASSVALLLNNTLDVPVRFRVVAEMMRDELKSAEEGGLPEVARVMSDVQRRLDLGRSGERVQQQEDRVISLLDKLLEDMQKQQQNGGGGGADGSNQQNAGTQGAAQSTIKGSAAEGEADRKELTENGAWGMLDQQSETKARELIRQQFPSNYLDVISRYTQKIAERK